MATTPSAFDHMAGVIAAVERACPHVGDGIAAMDRTLPYAVVYDLAGGNVEGPVSDPHADVTWPYQVTCVGETAEQCRALEDRIRSELDAGISVAGRTVCLNEPDGPFGAVQRDDSTGTTEFYMTPRWRLTTTPA